MPPAPGLAAIDLPAALTGRFAADLTRLLPAEGTLGLAVSGGPDSLALLLLAHAALGPRIQVQGFAASRFRRDPAEDWVDAEYEEVVPDRDKIGGPSKWSRH